MTEAEWLAATDPAPLLEFLHDRRTARDRKLRLFVLACCRCLVAPSFKTDRYLQYQFWFAPCVWEPVLEASEVYGDLPSDRSHAERANDRTAIRASRGSGSGGPYNVLRLAAGTRLESERVIRAVWNCAAEFGTPTRQEMWNLLNDVFSPWNPTLIDSKTPFDPTWLTPTVIALANGIYVDRAFDRMPILADALEEAGCDNVDVLLHCRGDGPHVRGCWVVDAVLGKE